jgi:hypothetical protein
MFKYLGLTCGLLFLSLLLSASFGSMVDVVHSDGCYFVYDWDVNTRSHVWFCTVDPNCAPDVCDETTQLQEGWRMCVCGGETAGSSPDFCMTWVHVNPLTGHSTILCFKPNPCSGATQCSRVPGGVLEMQQKRLCECR